jgi:predicted nicotinamide N-methyase
MQWSEGTLPCLYGDVRVLQWVPLENSKATTKDQDDESDEVAELVDAEDQLGAVMWNSNTQVIAYLHDEFIKLRNVEERPLEGSLILELGAGVGVLGIALAAGGAHAIVTDLKELVPLMNRNIELNADLLQRALETSPTVSKRRQTEISVLQPYTCSAMALRWGDKLLPIALTELVERRCSTGSTKGLDAIILCDALYGNKSIWPKLILDLKRLSCLGLNLLSGAVSIHSRPYIFNFCEQRITGVEDQFLQLLDADNWEIDRTILSVRSDLQMEIRATKFRYIGPIML